MELTVEDLQKYDSPIEFKEYSKVGDFMRNPSSDFKILSLDEKKRAIVFLDKGDARDISWDDVKKGMVPTSKIQITKLFSSFGFVREVDRADFLFLLAKYGLSPYVPQGGESKKLFDIATKQKIKETRNFVPTSYSYSFFLLTGKLSGYELDADGIRRLELLDGVDQDVILLIYQFYEDSHSTYDILKKPQSLFEIVLLEAFYNSENIDEIASQVGMIIPPQVENRFDYLLNNIYSYINVDKSLSLIEVLDNKISYLGNYISKIPDFEIVPFLNIKYESRSELMIKLKFELTSEARFFLWDGPIYGTVNRLSPQEYEKYVYFGNRYSNAVINLEDALYDGFYHLKEYGVYDILSFRRLLNQLNGFLIEEIKIKAEKYLSSFYTAPLSLSDFLEIFELKDYDVIFEILMKMHLYSVEKDKDFSAFILRDIKNLTDSLEGETKKRFLNLDPIKSEKGDPVQAQGKILDLEFLESTSRYYLAAFFDYILL